MVQAYSIQHWQSKLRHLPWLLPAWNRLPLALVLIMTIVLAQLAAKTTWQIFTSTTTSRVTGRSDLNSQSMPAKETNLAEVVNAHLFGSLATTASSGPISAPVTRLKLTLHGVFASDDAKLAMAIISDAGGRQKYYRIGDAVPGGARLHAIYKDRVILQREGKLETLKLPREVASFNTLPSPVTSSTTTGLNTQLPDASSKVIEIKASDKVKQLRETLINSPQQIWKDVRIEPVLEGGKIQGYRFAHKDRQLMQSLGLKPDDVIVEINGMALSDPSVLYDIMSQITSMENVSLTIKRKGQTETIDITM